SHFAISTPSIILIGSLVTTSNARREHILLVPLHLSQPRFADGDAFGFAIVIPHGAEGERLALFLEGEAGGEVAGEFGGADGGRFEQGEEQGALEVARADDPRGDAIDARVEVVEAEVD